MTESERPARGASLAGLPESNAATKPHSLIGHCRGPVGRSAPFTLAELNQQLRDEQLRAAFDSADQWTRSCWRQVITYLAAGDQPFSSDTCRELGAPEPGHPNHVGALFMAAAKAGLITPVGFVQSTRRPRHAGWLRQWTGVAA